MQKKLDDLKTIGQCQNQEQQQLQERNSNKKRSMKKRLSGHKNLSNLFKEIEAERMQSSDNGESCAIKKGNRCFELNKLVDMSRNTLSSKVNNDPFVKKGLEMIKKEQKKNCPKGHINIAPRQSVLDQSRINLRQKKMMDRIRQKQILGLVDSKLSDYNLKFSQDKEN